MTQLSVNINKVATLRNARGGNMPDVLQFAKDCYLFGAEGITVHPRPDERHIRRQDVSDISAWLQGEAASHRLQGEAISNRLQGGEDCIFATTPEFNIEGNPQDAFCNLVLQVKPTQVTLVPDAEDQITSNHGWDTKAHLQFLQTKIESFHKAGIRVSVFVDADPEMVQYAAEAGADRVELYTGPYAEMYESDPRAAIEQYRPAAEMARNLGIGLNAGHDLNLHNLQALIQAFPWINEVSIGHALIADALYLGIAETIKQYKSKINKS